MVEIGKKIKELRQSKKMTQKELAEVLNVTPQAVSKWERNASNPDLQTLLTLSRYFDVSVDEILGNIKQTFFDSLFSKMKRGKQMKNSQNTNVEQVSTDTKVLIFDLSGSFMSDKGLLQTQILNSKLQSLMNKNEKKIIVDTYESSQLNKYGEQADIILLTPSFSFARKEIEKQFPTVPVIEISKRDYGLLDIENIYQEIINVIQ
ncbi:helix-turn-helix domain-containing protein [Candidatus Enterococcus courvalinii]|uniref:Helix-turn-helix domain-containing protein n=1 Tax=Candidatus Enterococcus courvalinii TaxID=2815329 RepID=A0ABS3I0I1_9ENTE|nr:helix-turn-helix domain-containing protein [Enterococcus sp. MSG2901]MBO0482229.1 helix-turn-helix domain-containing protein [Enterococcus sp. MSG2901]